MATLIGLAWLCLPTAEFLRESSTGTAERVVALAMVAAFAAYVLVGAGNEDDEPVSRRQSLKAAAFPAAVTVGLVALGNDEWVPVMAVFVAVITGVGLRGWHIGAAIAVVAAASFGLMLAAGTDTGEATYDTSIIVTISATISAITALTRTNKELQHARAELASVAVANERRRFARDLHDLLGHSLSLIAIKARLAQRVQHSDPARATQELADIESAARTSLAEVREAVSGYRRATIATELAGVRSALESAGVALDTRVTRMELDAEDEAVLAWALREATTNVVRHAGAGSVIVRLEPAGHGARLEVEDDGSGATNGSTGNGLMGLAERVAARDGWLETGTSPGGGFRLTVELPGTITM
jgi:two-component system sensor histidine kinase DesK